MRKALVMLVLLLGIVAPATAKEGVYLGGGATYNFFTGDDFNDVDPGFGFGAKLGFRAGGFGLEGNYVQADIPDSDTTFSGFSLDLRLPFYSASSSGGLYVLAGYGYYEIEDDAGNGLKGTGYNLGGGVEFSLTDNVAIDLAGIYRFITYDEINGITVPDVDGDTLTISATLNLYFGSSGPSGDQRDDFRNLR